MLADLVFLAILLISALFGLKQGFINMLGRLVLLALSAAVTLLLLGPLTSLLLHSNVLAPWSDKISAYVLDPLEKTATSVESAIASLNLPPFLAKLMQSGVSPGGSVTQAHDQLSTVLVQFALSGVAFILIFLVVGLLIHVIARSLTRVADSVPVISTLNRAGGLVVGLVFGLAGILIILLLAGFAAPYLPAIAEQVAKSRIASYFYSINILYYLI
jgi:hypothetical protein